MFFTDPVGAFTHLHGLLRPGGRMALACWAPLKKNAWMLEVRNILSANFEMPVPPPRIPGPYAFEEPEYLREILTRAGFSGFEGALWEAELPAGGPGSAPEAAADFLLSALSMAQRALDAPPAVREKVRSELVQRLRAFHTPSGVRLPAAAWLYTARA
jgi:SAM-dependent methyltransferase